MYYYNKQYVKTRLEIFFLLHECVSKVVYVMLYKKKTASSFLLISIGLVYKSNSKRKCIEIMIVIRERESCCDYIIVIIIHMSIYKLVQYYIEKYINKDIFKVIHYHLFIK